ncbi:alpha/beta hydrolase-fold protein [Alteromonas gracilis]|uniref:alpha/beta hydrolase-fold protein n=1 Tax=Alteromonas gracilis TaxID=1479524 RepID=UPI00373544F3
MRLITLATMFIAFFKLTIVYANESHDIYIPASQNSFSNVARHTITSRFLYGSQVVDVSLPVNYHETGYQIKYPLVVVLDGELLFHSVSGFVQFQAMNSQMPEAIVVGIQNLPETRRDMTPRPLNKKGEPLWFGGKEDLYLSFIRNELMPFLDEQYRIADFKVLIGLSPSASLTLHSFWKQPSLFSGYIVINQADFSAVAYGGETIFDKVINSVKQQEKGNRFLYISMPKGGAARNPKILQDYKRLEKELSPFIANKLSFKWELIDKQSYAAVLPAVMSGFELIFPAHLWDVNYHDFVSQEVGMTLNNIRAHFSELSDEYSFMALPKGERYYNRNRLKRIVYILIQQKRYSEAESILNYWLSIYPYSSNVHDTFADLYHVQGNTNLELKHRINALDLAKKHNDYRATLFEEALENLRSTLSKAPQQ